MIVAFLKSKIESLSANAKDGLDLSPLWVLYGEPAVWRKKSGQPVDWYVYSDPRITTDDLALAGTILAKPQLIKANYGSEAKTEADRITGAAKTREDALASVTDWDRGVVGTETVTVTVSERVILSYDSVSIGMFCIAWDDTANDGLGECTAWEERFEQVPVYEQVDSGEVDENGDPIMVDKWVDVDYQVTQDVYLSPQEIMEAQGPQVKNWVLAGSRVREDLEPIVEDI